MKSNRPTLKLLTNRRDRPSADGIGHPNLSLSYILGCTGDTIVEVIHKDAENLSIICGS